MRLEPYPTALTVAGSDSGGGAGIQADLKTFLDHRVFGMSVICAITAQNTRGVTRVDAVPVEGVLAQLDAVFADLPVGAVKIGMLGTADLARAVAGFLRALPQRPPVVLDPVMVATTGARLLDDDAVAVVRDELLPLAALATPNVDEARVLAGSDAFDRVLAWARSAPCAVLITGGDDVGDDVVDTLVVGGEIRVFRAPRIPGRSFHGTGCTLSSAVAARLSRGEPLDRAVDGALAYVKRLIGRAVEGSVGGGHPVLPHGLFNTP